MSTLGDVYTEARAHLADVAAEVWTDAVLLPFANRGYRFCARFLRAQGMGLFRKQSASISVASTATYLVRPDGVAVNVYPSDLIRPIEIRESLTTGWKAMKSSDGFLPSDNTDRSLKVWDWREDKIVFPGFVGAAISVQIQYEAELAALSAGIDKLLIPDGIDAVALMTASYAAKSRDEQTVSEMLQKAATDDLVLIARAEQMVKRAGGARWGTQ